MTRARVSSRAAEQRALDDERDEQSARAATCNGTDRGETSDEEQGNDDREGVIGLKRPADCRVTGTDYQRLSGEQATSDEEQRDRQSECKHAHDGGKVRDDGLRGENTAGEQLGAHSAGEPERGGPTRSRKSNGGAPFTGSKTEVPLMATYTT